MKKYYEEPNFEEVIFEAVDVIMTSGGSDKDDSNEYNDNSDEWEGDLGI